MPPGSGIGAGLGVDKKLRGERGGENVLRKQHNPFMITSPMKYSVSPGQQHRTLYGDAIVD